MLLSACGKSEVESCDAPAVLSVIEKKNTSKFKDAQKLREGTGVMSGFRSKDAKSLLESGENLSGVVINVRQTSYDKTNNTRFCAADFKYEGKISEDYRAVASFFDRSVCEKNFTYKIEKLLDKPDDFYVTWRCSR